MQESSQMVNTGFNELSRGESTQSPDWKIVHYQHHRTPTCAFFHRDLTLNT